MNDEVPLSNFLRRIAGVMGVAFVVGAPAMGIMYWLGYIDQEPFREMSTSGLIWALIGSLVFIYVAVKGRLPNWFAKGASGNHDLLRKQ